MIRINLLGTPKPKRGKGSRAAVSSGPVLPQLEMGGTSIVVLTLAVGILAVILCWYLNNEAGKEHTRITNELVASEIRIKQLSGVKAAYEEKQKQAAQLKKRFDVIDQLRAAQTGWPVNLLNTVADTVNKTDAVWVNTMTEDGKDVNVAGVALSHVAVANLMSNLKRTGFFKNVELKETVQENYRGLPAFKFSLVCEKQAEKKA